MLKRINVSIFSPSKIAFFLKDRLSYIFLYIALLSLIAGLPMSLRIALSNEMPRQMQTDIRNMIIRNNVNCQIEDGLLQACNHPGFSYNYINIQFNGAPISGSYVVSFNEAQMHILFDEMVLNTYTYEDLGLTNFDFTFKTENDRLAFNQALNRVYQDIKPFTVPFSFAFMLISNMLLYIILALIMAFFYGMRPEKLRFRYRFILASYALTSYFVTILIGELYGLGILSYLALILPYIYMGIAFRGLLRLSKIVVIKDDSDEKKE